MCASGSSIRPFYCSPGWGAQLPLLLIMFPHALAPLTQLSWCSLGVLFSVIHNSFASSWVPTCFLHMTSTRTPRMSPISRKSAACPSFSHSVILSSFPTRSPQGSLPDHSGFFHFVWPFYILCEFQAQDDGRFDTGRHLDSFCICPKQKALGGKSWEAAAALDGCDIASVSPKSVTPGSWDYPAENH